jgi:hypothetical protein
MIRFSSKRFPERKGNKFEGAATKKYQEKY